MLAEFESNSPKLRFRAVFIDGTEIGESDAMTELPSVLKMAAFTAMRTFELLRVTGPSITVVARIHMDTGVFEVGGNALEFSGQAVKRRRIIFVRSDDGVLIGWQGNTPQGHNQKCTVKIPTP